MDSRALTPELQEVEDARIEYTQANQAYIEGPMSAKTALRDQLGCSEDRLRRAIKGAQQAGKK